jgi:hypothetical protein
LEDIFDLGCDYSLLWHIRFLFLIVSGICRFVESVDFLMIASIYCIFEQAWQFDWDVFKIRNCSVDDSLLACGEQLSLPQYFLPWWVKFWFAMLRLLSSREPKSRMVHRGRNVWPCDRSLVGWRPGMWTLSCCTNGQRNLWSTDSELSDESRQWPRVLWKWQFKLEFILSKWNNLLSAWLARPTCK